MLKAIAAIILIGYLSFGRTFAYLGIGAFNFYVGEAVLLTFLLTQPKAWLDRWIDNLAKPGKIQLLCWSLLLFAAYGASLLIRGLLAGRESLSTAENAAFNIYPLYLFFGLWLGARGFDLRLTLNRLAWFQGIYGLFYLAIFSRLQWIMPGTTTVPIFGAPIGSGLALIALICMPAGRLTWIPLLLNAFVLLSLQVRAEWVSCLVALLLVGLLKRARVVLAGMAVVAVLLTLGSIADLKMDGPRGEISTRNIAGRFLSVVNPEAAEPGSVASVYNGTVTWRQRWWTEIWNEVHSDPFTMLFGLGYGYPLSYLAPFIKDPAIRTPHNIFYYCLGYGGWFGVFTFSALQFSLLLMHIRNYLRTGDPFGIAVFALYLVEACFSNLFETPFGAIPYYLLSGLAVSPMRVPSSSAFRLKRTAYRAAPAWTRPQIGVAATTWRTQ